jgi:hypothetical protein
MASIVGAAVTPSLSLRLYRCSCPPLRLSIPPTLRKAKSFRSNAERGVCGVGTIKAVDLTSIVVATVKTKLKMRLERIGPSYVVREVIAKPRHSVNKQYANCEEHRSRVR